MIEISTRILEPDELLKVNSKEEMEHIYLILKGRGQVFKFTFRTIENRLFPTSIYADWYGDVDWYKPDEWHRPFEVALQKLEIKL